MTKERNNIEHLMWRKKVDNSLFEGEIVIPMAFVKQWNLKKHFKDTGEKVEYYPVHIKFGSKFYDGRVFYRHPTKKRSSEQHKIQFQQGNLVEDLKKSFLMSHIRWLEVELRKQSGKKSAEATNETQREAPFWEFLDIEFDELKKQFVFTAYYKQLPYFPEVFKHLIGSPKLKQIENSIFNNFEKINSQEWKKRDQLVTEIGARNVIYFLLDDKNKLIYVGETSQDLKTRLSDKQFYLNAGIPDWTHYRFEALPSSIDTKARKEIEHLSIRSYASLFSNTKDLKSFKISEYKLVNKDIRN